MTTSSSRHQAEREAIAREFADAPRAQQDLLTLLSEQTPPPAETEAPPMPADLLDRLRGHYGYTEETPATIFDTPRRPAPAPGFIDRLRKWFAVPALQWGGGLVTACLAVVLGVIFLRPSPPVETGGPSPDQWRGSQVPVNQSGPVYVWAGSAADADRAAVADRVPDMLDAASADAALEISRNNPDAIVYVLDAAAGTVSVLVNGETTTTQTVRAGSPPNAKAAGLLDALRKAQRAATP